jgi:hypothetical protein
VSELLLKTQKIKMMSTLSQAKNNEKNRHF